VLSSGAPTDHASRTFGESSVGGGRLVGSPQVSVWYAIGRTDMFFAVPAWFSYLHNGRRLNASPSKMFVANWHMLDRDQGRWSLD
jgi:hypothetical protein